MAFGMQDYEQQVAARKESLFAELFQSRIHNLLEIGLGTGPNLKYYAAQKVSILCGSFTSCRKKPMQNKYRTRFCKYTKLASATETACLVVLCCVNCTS